MLKQFTEISWQKFKDSITSLTSKVSRMYEYFVNGQINGSYYRFTADTTYTLYSRRTKIIKGTKVIRPTLTANTVTTVDLLDHDTLVEICGRQLSEMDTVIVCNGDQAANVDIMMSAAIIMTEGTGKLMVSMLPKTNKNASQMRVNFTIILG